MLPCWPAPLPEVSHSVLDGMTNVMVWLDGMILYTLACILPCWPAPLPEVSHSVLDGMANVNVT